jgi:hypothetical protein
MPDLGIDSRYSSAAQNYNEMCFMGISKMFLRTYTAQAVFWADFTQNPIDRVSRLYRSYNFVLLYLKFNVFCLQELYCNPIYNFLNCTDCDANGCYYCDPGFNITTVNAIDICAFTNCEPLGFYNCTACFADECLACSAGLYFYNKTDALNNSQVICATDQCVSLFSQTNCLECAHAECLDCEVGFYFKTINGIIMCATTQCLTLLSYSSCD